MSAGRATLTRTVAACALGSAVSVFAATRTWAVQVQAQPAPLGPLHVTRAGSYFVPWLSALGLVGLAGTGALLATRGRWRSGVGVLIALAGLGILAGGVYGLASIDGVRVGWPLLCIPAGLLLAAGGAMAAARSTDWPAMGARYERRPTGSSRSAPAPSSRTDDRAVANGRGQAGDHDDDDLDGDGLEEVEEAPAHVERSGPSPSEIAMWDALDRGEDPSQ